MSFKVHFGLDELRDISNERVSVRAVVKNRNKFLMISTKRGDLIFPGGRIEAEESYVEAVERELLEETGYISTSEPKYLGEIVNIRKDRFDKDKLYKSTMHFFLCEVGNESRKKSLSNRERDLNLEPIWLEDPEIIEINQKYDKTMAVENVLSMTTEFIISKFLY